MLIYLIIICMLLVLAYRYDYKGYVKNRNLWENAVLLLMIFVVGLRYHIGSDTVVYVPSRAGRKRSSA